MKTVLSFALALALSAPVFADGPTPEEQFYQGWYLETGTKDLEGAMAAYAKLVERAKESEAYAAHAQFQIGACLEKMGKKEEAQKAFQKVVDRFPEQKEWVEKAQGKLKGAPAAAAAADPSRALLEKMRATKVSLNFEQAPLPDALTFYREYLRQSIVLDARVKNAEDKKITLRVNDLPFDQALDLTIKGCDLEWCVDEGVVIVSTKEGVAAHAQAVKKEAEAPDADAAWKADIQKKLDDTKIDLDFTDTSLGDVADFLREYADLNIVFDAGLRDDGTIDKKITLQLRDVKLGTAIRLLLTQYGLTSEYANHVLHITRHADHH